MGRTRTQLRQLVAKETRISIFRTGTADSGGTTTTLVDAPLGNVPNDTFNGAYLYLTSGSPTNNDLLITDFASSTGTCTFKPALGGAPDALTFEILPFSAEQFHSAINDTLSELAAERVLLRRFLSHGLLTGSPAYNADFAYWTGANAPAGYTVDSGTITRQNTITYLSDQNLSIASGVVSVANPYRRFFLDFVSDPVYFGCWVYATAASSTRINLVVDGTSNYSSYHSGDSGWELLTVDVTLGDNLESVIPKFEATGTTSYFSDWYVYANNRHVPLLWTRDLYPNGPEEVSASTHNEHNASTYLGRGQYRKRLPVGYDYSVSEAGVAGATQDSNVGWILATGVPTGRRLFCRTSAPLTLPGANTDVVEINPQEATLVAKRAAIKLLEQLQQYAPADLAKSAAQRVAQLQRDIAASMQFLESTRGAAELTTW